MPRLSRRVLFRLGAIIAVPILLLGGCLVLEQIPMAQARPPETVKTLDDFHKWKGRAIVGTGTFENSGVTYTVVLAPAGRYLASGPSAYLFDREGRFVDWTADMGDLYTVKNRFNLTSGRVKNIRREPTPVQPSSPSVTNHVSTEADAIAVVLAGIRRQGGDPQRKECSAKNIDGAWWVTAWHIWYPNNVGSSRFVPGGFTTYVVSTNGTILRTLAGK